jgi:fatty acid desaturase
VLREKADRRTITFVVVYFGLLITGYATDLTLATGLPLTVALCLMSFFCAVATHNTVHAPIFHSKALNRVFQATLTVCYGHPVSAYVPGHNLSHHRYTQTARDIMRTNKLRFRWNLLNQLMFSTVVGPAIFKANADYVRAMRKQRPAWFRQFCVETAVYLTFLIALFVLDWQKFLLFVLIPHQYAAFGIMGINFVQHDGCDPDDTYNHSRNFTGKLINWFTFNNGYHGIHHMHPSLHWSKLPEAHARELRPHLHPQLDRSGLLPYLIEAYVWPGKRMRYDGTPVVLPPAVADEAWFQARETFDPTDLGAIAS